MKIKLLGILILLVASTACRMPHASTPHNMPQNKSPHQVASSETVLTKYIDVEMKSTDIEFTTEDGFIINGKLYSPQTILDSTEPAPAVVLLPMLGHTIETYNPLIPRLIDKGYHVLAINMRGHGSSINTTNGKTITYQTFSTKDWKKLPLDIDAALNYLKTLPQINLAKTILVGASIGANTAIISAAQHAEIKTVVAISPGLNFKGLKPEDYINKTNADIYLMAAKDDTYSAQTVEALKDNATRYLIYPEGGHGTNMFENIPDSTQTVIKFINNSFTN
jgi:dienelactone hydrolase